MKIVDTKGQKCPAPLIAAKRALNEASDGESFIVITDSKTSFQNLSRFFKDNNVDFEVSEKESEWNFTVIKRSGVSISSKAEDYCTVPVSHFEKGDFVVVISSDRMGNGDDDLGGLLMENFIKAIVDLDSLPAKILFYNGGVSLATDSSPVISQLKSLEKMGVEILLCATCVNHFSLSKNINIGILSNMFEIANIMASSLKIIKP